MYGCTDNKKKIKSSRERLAELYSRIPDTKGCMDHNSKSESEGGCGAWCCKSQSPQTLYAEFLNTWNYVIKEWKDSEISVLIEKCLRKYLFPNQDKGCVFFNKDNNLCSQHQTRPLACRVYGIEPEEEFKPKYERLKVIYPETRYQCNLVSTVTGEPVTKKETDGWWLELSAIEMGIGIKKDIITDAPGGSYRTYHDHILINMLGGGGMEQLSKLRVDGSPQEKEHTIQKIMLALKAFKEKLSNDKEAKA